VNRAPSFLRVCDHGAPLARSGQYRRCVLIVESRAAHAHGV
jgi:hypothetical protein